MTDDDSLEEHSALRERLAAEPSPAMPDDVAVQLHAALEHESRSRQEAYAEPAASDEVAPVVPMRRRWKAPLVAAASVVAVVAVAIPVWNEMDGGGPDSDAAAGGAADDSSPHGSQSPEDGGANAAPDTGSARPDESESQLSSADFAADVRAMLAETDRLAMTEPSSMRSAVSCGGGSPSSDRGVPATLDGRPVVILTSSQSADSPRVTARAVACGPDGPRVAAQASVPDPS